MSRASRARGGTGGAARPTPAPLSRGRRIAFTAVALLFPVILLLLVEGLLRLAWQGGAIPVFVERPERPSERIANPRLAARWFVAEAAPPAPQREGFAAAKPANGFRVFALGESSTAGFPYPRNATFSRYVAEVLRDVLPADSVEVVNLGIAATNSHAMADIIDDVIAQQPDAVLLYAGHNEYYGALGVGSTQSLPGGDAVVRTFLRLQRWRVFMAVRQGVGRMRGSPTSSIAADSATASLMEVMAGNRAIVHGDDAYRRGVAQFERNLAYVARRLQSAGVPLLIGSVESNLADQPPFAVAANDAPGGARAAFADARAALARGDSAAAHAGFVRARDLDVVRFRAPGEFNAVIQRVAQAHGATYVPVAETFARHSPAGIPGGTLFLEHVHPTAEGYALLAQAFVEPLLAHDVVRRRAPAMNRLRGWDTYADERWLTELDLQIAAHVVATLAQRWPFVAADRQRDYRGTYRPADLRDSLAFDASRGASWERAKLALAHDRLARGAAAEAAREYRGLVRDAPGFPEPRELLGAALLAAGDAAGADTAYRTANAIRPTAANAGALGEMAMNRRDAAAAARHFQQAAALAPGDAPLL
nr:hypothetical protein [Gemmatimonadaceae bacterium]